MRYAHSPPHNGRLLMQGLQQLTRTAYGATLWRQSNFAFANWENFFSRQSETRGAARHLFAPSA